MKHKPILSIVLIVIIVAGCALFLRKRGEESNPESVHEVYGTGTIEATEVDVAAQAPGLVTQVLVEEGDTVKAGDVIAHLDTRTLEAQRSQAKAAVDAAAANLDLALHGSRAEQIRAGRASLEAARSSERMAKAKLDQLRNGARPEEKRQATAVLAQAETHVEGNREALATAQENYRSVTPLKQQLDVAQATYDAALAQQEQARAQLALVLEGARQEERDRAAASLRNARASKENTDRHFHRATQLYNDGAISKQMLDDAEAAAKSSSANVDAAAAQVAELQAGSRPEEVKRAQAALEQARVNAAGVKQTLINARKLYTDRLEARGQLESAQTQLASSLQQRKQAAAATVLVYRGPRVEEIRAARAALDQAHAQSQTAQAQLDLLLAGERKEVIDRAKADLERARGSLAEIESRLKDAVILSSLSGIVAEKVVEPGEVVTAGLPIIRMYDMKRPWLKVYVPITHLGRVKVGQRATITCDTFPGKRFPAHVERVSEEAEFTPKNVQTKEQRVQLVFWVKLAIDNSTGELKPGMPAEGVIQING